MPPYDTNTTADELVHDYADLIKGRVILTTGVSPGGLGDFFVQSIAKAQPSWLLLAGRSAEKLQQMGNEIMAVNPSVQVRTVHVDLGSLQSAQEAAATVNAWSDIPAIDVLVNNAGIMAPDFVLSADGFEKQLATNHLGPFLFTNLIMPKVLASKSPRIVMVSSDGHRLSPIRFYDYNFDNGTTYNKWYAYGQSKTANMLMAISLAEKLGPKHGLLAFSLHPGVIFTNLANHISGNEEWDALRAADKTLGNREGWREFNPKPLERGVSTHIYAAFDPDLAAHNGEYLIDTHVGDPHTDTILPWATSHFEAERLWKLSEKLVGEEFSY